MGNCFFCLFFYVFLYSKRDFFVLTVYSLFQVNKVEVAEVVVVGNSFAFLPFQKHSACNVPKKLKNDRFTFCTVSFFVFAER